MNARITYCVEMDEEFAEMIGNMFPVQLEQAPKGNLVFKSTTEIDGQNFLMGLLKAKRLYTELQKLTGLSNDVLFSICKSMVMHMSTTADGKVVDEQKVNFEEYTERFFGRKCNGEEA